MTQKNYKTKNRKLDLRRYKLHILFIVTTYFSFFLLIEGHSQVNDIILSSRSFHPRDNNDTFSTIKMIKTYGVTSVEWMYCNNKSQLSQLQDLGIKYTLAINPQTPDSLGYTAVKTRIVNIDNLPLTPPWMKEWKIKNPYWGCVNNPEFKQVLVQVKNVNFSLQYSSKWNIFIFSMLNDYSRGLYKHKETGFILPFDAFNINWSDERNWDKLPLCLQSIPKEFLFFLRDNFIFFGAISTSQFMGNI